MTPEDRKRPSKKRSDEMRALLLENGITVNDDNQLEPIDTYEEFIFQINEKIKFEDDAPISTYQFLQDYV